MLKITLKKQALLVAMLAGIATASFAEEAPVFDADNYPPQFDEQPADSYPPPSQSYGPSSSQPSRSTLSYDQRLARAEQQINTLQHADAVGKLNALQSEVQSLRGQVEQLNHQLQQLQNQQRTQYADLDKRINNKQPTQAIKTQPSVVPDDTIPQADSGNIPSPVTTTTTTTKPKSVAKPKLQPQIPAETVDTTTSPASVPVAKTAAVASTNADAQQPDVAEEQQTYQTAYDLIKAKKYNEAIAALQKMLRKYPTGQFAANAHYWLGELYGLLGKNDESAVEFDAVVKNYPSSPKVSDAQLKLGLIYAAQFKWVDAKAAFKKVVSRFPGSASARLATDQLKQIKAAGH